jgi:ribose transport system permease protein
MFSGLCAAVAAILYSARLGIGLPSLGNNLLLDIIGATVIGGTSLFGGKGSIKGTFFGVAFFVLLLNILNAMRLSPFIIDAVKGMVILLAALLDITRSRLINREARS